MFHNGSNFREKNPDVITLPQQFKNNGYYTMTIGKVFHGGENDTPSWSEVLKAKTLGEPYPVKAVNGYPTAGESQGHGGKNCGS